MEIHYMKVQHGYYKKKQEKSKAIKTHFTFMGF